MLYWKTALITWKLCNIWTISKICFHYSHKPNLFPIKIRLSTPNEMLSMSFRFHFSTRFSEREKKPSIFAIRWKWILLNRSKQLCNRNDVRPHNNDFSDSKIFFTARKMKNQLNKRKSFLISVYLLIWIFFSILIFLVQILCSSIGYWMQRNLRIKEEKQN